MTKYNFDDVEPLPLSPEGITVATVLYSDAYKRYFGLLKALQAQKEYSDRALYLTHKVISLNAAHYSVWQYRYHIILTMKKDIVTELNWVESIATENVKNYQIWYYRQLLLTELNEKDPKREFPLIEVMLTDDPKNYHVWSHRKWLIKWSDVWDNELEFVEKHIDEDVYNNSAWAHRFFTVFGQKDTLNDDEFKRETIFTISKIELAPQNVSSWNYLVGIYEKSGKPLAGLKELALRYSNVIDTDNELHSVPALELLAKIYLEENPEKAKKGYDLLATKYDTIRSNYWEYQKSLVA